MTEPSPRHIRMETLDEGIVRYTLDRPPVNALGREMIEGLDAICAHLETTGPAEVRVVIVAAEGRYFSAGADLKERKGMTIEQVKEWVPYQSGVLDRVARLPMPTIAVLQGLAAGGGLELALSCDLRIAEEPATLGLRETALAIIPGAGGTQRLPRLIGPSRAKRWILTAAMHSAREALDDGVIDRLVAAGEGGDAALRIAEAIAANGPVAIRLAKRAIEKGSEMPLSSGLEEELRCYEGTLLTEDRVEALKAFAEKRTPEFKGR